MSEMLYRRIEPLEEGTLVQYLGCYALRWGRDAEPSCGFVEAQEEMDALDAAQQRIAALEAQVEAWQLASGLTVPAEERGGDPGNVTPEHLRQHLAALEAQAQAANLRAERLRTALRRCERMGNAIGKRSWEELRDVTWAALAAEPSPSPLAQVREALAFYREPANHMDGRYEGGTSECQRDLGEKARAALALLAELGVRDATS